jgi:hypothetical protein
MTVTLIKPKMLKKADKVSFGKLASSSTLVARSQSFSSADPPLRQRTLASLRLCLGLEIQRRVKLVEGEIAFMALIPERELSPRWLPPHLVKAGLLESENGALQIP